MNSFVKYGLFLLVTGAIAAVSYGPVRPITYAAVGLIVGVFFIKWFTAYHRTHKVAKWAEVLGDGFFLLVISTVFVTLCSTFFKTLKKDVPRDPLVTAITQGSGEKIQKILSTDDLKQPAAKKARVDKMDEQGRTPLMWAAYVDFSDAKKTLETDGPRVALADLLVAAGADPNARDKDGWTPLTWAAWSGMPKMTARLLELGAQVNAADRQGQTALMIAASRGNAEVVKLLLAHGADRTAAARNGKTARTFAEEGIKAYFRRAEAYQAELAIL
jgi:hypothetical protein